MSEPGEDRIRMRAHQLWEAAGKPDGRDQEFWIEAERQLAEEVADNPTKNRTGFSNKQHCRALELSDQTVGFGTCSRGYGTNVSKAVWRGAALGGSATRSPRAFGGQRGGAAGCPLRRFVRQSSRPCTKPWMKASLPITPGERMKG